MLLWPHRLCARLLERQSEKKSKPYCPPPRHQSAFLLPSLSLYHTRFIKQSYPLSPRSERGVLDLQSVHPREEWCLLLVVLAVGGKGWVGRSWVEREEELTRTGRGLFRGGPTYLVSGAYSIWGKRAPLIAFEVLMTRSPPRSSLNSKR